MRAIACVCIHTVQKQTGVFQQENETLLLQEKNPTYQRRLLFALRHLSQRPFLITVLTRSPSVLQQLEIAYAHLRRMVLLQASPLPLAVLVLPRLAVPQP